jgi:hypothetical protein
MTWHDMRRHQQHHFTDPAAVIVAVSVTVSPAAVGVASNKTCRMYPLILSRPVRLGIPRPQSHIMREGDQ